MVRFAVPPNARLLREAKIEAARRIVFGPARGLPGERWWARPLVARDMLHWYFPSKFGLPDFRLSEYYAMQAERFQPRTTPRWVHMFEELAAELRQGDPAELFSISDDDQVNADLRAMYAMVTKHEAPESNLTSVQPKANVSPTLEGSVGDSRVRFVDPLFRRRRLKWMERFLAGMNNAKEIKYNRHFTRRPNEQEQWPTNLGSVTVKWPNRRN